jgi:uncharacterized protein YegL
MRRLPVYFLLDTSGSMYGEPIEALNNALSGMISSLRSDPQALDSVWVSIVTFDRDVKVLTPLTDLANFQMPDITCPQSGPTHTGKALETLHQKIKEEVIAGSALRFDVVPRDDSGNKVFKLRGHCGMRRRSIRR